MAIISSERFERFPEITKNGGSKRLPRKDDN
jgi:hypothetical protein